MYYRIRFSYEKIEEEKSTAKKDEENANGFMAKLVGKDVIFSTDVKSDSLLGAFKTFSRRVKDNTEEGFEAMKEETLRMHEADIKNTFAKLMESFKKRRAQKEEKDKEGGAK